MKILLVADQRGWVFERHCNEIKKRITEHKIDIAFRKDHIKAKQDNYDLIYVLDPIPLSHGYPDPKKTILGLRCEFLHREHPQGAKGLYENGFPGRCSSIKDKCSVFHVVNRNMFELYTPIVTDKPLLLAQHGVDEEIFNREKHPIEKHDNFTVGIVGRLSPNKGGDILLAACKEAGVNLVAAEYNRPLTKEEMPKFYTKMDAYICLSESEGLHNPTMEAGAMGLPVITTRCGAAEEIVIHGENGMFVDRNVRCVTEALTHLKSNPSVVTDMGDNMYNTIMNKWTWKYRIEDFRAMFNR